MCKAPLLTHLHNHHNINHFSNCFPKHTIPNTGHFSETIHTFTKNISVVIHKVPHHQRLRIFKNKIIMQSSAMINQLQCFCNCLQLNNEVLQGWYTSCRSRRASFLKCHIGDKNQTQNNKHSTFSWVPSLLSIPTHNWSCPSITHLLVMEMIDMGM
jgi:hypothetical protein